MKTLNELQYGMRPEEMGTTGLIRYVQGPHWPCVPETTCFAARMDLAMEIITKRVGPVSALLFRKAVYAN